jgi:hypothetical protein
MLLAFNGVAVTVSTARSTVMGVEAILAEEMAVPLRAKIW